VLGYRVLERGEITHGIDPTPRTGAYLEEVASRGQAVASWKF
jgi:hypothetical protein